MGEIWDIPASDEEEILVLLEEGHKEPAVRSAYDVSVEIVQADRDPYFIESGEQATIGVIHDIALQGTEALVNFDLHSGSRYVGTIAGGMEWPSSRVGFVTTDVLHEGFYIGRRLRIEFRRDPNTEEWQIPVRLPLIRVHRPHRDGCTAETIVTSMAKAEGDATFEFVGIKGGSGLGFTTQLTTKLSAGSICKEEVIPAILIVQHGATLINGQTVAYGTRYRIVDVDPSCRETRRIPPGIDNCGKPPIPAPEPKPQSWSTFNKTGVPNNESNDDSEIAKMGSTGYVSVGLGTEVGSVPLKLSVEMKRTIEWEYEISAVLRGGAKYLRFPVYPSAESLPLEICWSILDEADFADHS